MSDEGKKVDLSVHTENILMFRKDWEEGKWAGMGYENFGALAIMFPAPCQEIFPIIIDESGKTLCLMVIRKADDPIYGGMFHNPGTAHRSTDGVTITSAQNDPGFKYIPKEILEAEQKKATWTLTPRQKALHRVLTGAEIGLPEEYVLNDVLPRVQMAGNSPLEWTPRGVENTVLNVWVLTESEYDDLKKSMPDYCEFVNVDDLFDLALDGKFIRHQVNRFAQMMRYVKKFINPKVPILRILQG